MRPFLVLALLLHVGAAAAQEAAKPTVGTEVFTGGGEVLQPREKPAQPVTTYWHVQLYANMAAAPQRGISRDFAKDSLGLREQSLPNMTAGEP